MASLEECAVEAMTRRDETLCSVCHSRKIQGKGSTCHTLLCKRKGGRVRFLKNSSKTQGEDKKSRCDEAETMKEAEEPSRLCIYCGNRSVTIGPSVCFDKTCISRHAAAKFPPRIRVSTVNHVEKDSSGDEREDDSEDDASSADSVSIPWDSDDSSDETESNYDSSEHDSTVDSGSMAESVDDEESEASSMVVEEESLEEESGEDLTVEMCENCHRQPLFDHHPEIVVTRLPYYFNVQPVPKDLVKFWRAYTPISIKEIMMMKNLFVCAHNAEFILLKQGSQQILWRQNSLVTFGSYTVKRFSIWRKKRKRYG